MESDKRYEYRIDCEHYLPPYGGCALFSENGGVGDPALDIPCFYQIGDNEKVRETV